MDSAIYDVTRRRIEAEAARREREIRADLIEDVTAAIRAESERIRQAVGWTGDMDEALATVAVDAVADYYRKAVVFHVPINTPFMF